MLSCTAGMHDRGPKNNNAADESAAGQTKDLSSLDPQPIEVVEITVHRRLLPEYEAELSSDVPGGVVGGIDDGEDFSLEARGCQGE